MADSDEQPQMPQLPQQEAPHVNAAAQEVSNADPQQNVPQPAPNVQQQENLEVKL